MILKIGETYIHGHGRKQADDLIRACTKFGLHPTVIRTTDSGFIVPNAVAEEVERATVPAWAGEEAVF